MQREMNLIGMVSGERANLPWDHIACCDTPQAAMRLCVRRAQVYRTREDIAEILNVDRSQFNTMLSSDGHKRTRNMPFDLAEDLQDLCCNNAINQWQQLYRTRGLNCQKSKQTQEAELLRALEQLRRQA